MQDRAPFPSTLLLALVACTPGVSTDTVTAQPEPAPTAVDGTGREPRPDVSPRMAERAGAPAVEPRVEVTIEGDDICDVDVDARGFPAFDPREGTVVTLERSVLQLSSYSVGTLDLVLRDARTGRTLEAVALLGEVSWPDESAEPNEDRPEPDPCGEAHRETQANLEAIREGLARTRWEAMPELPLEFVKYGEMNLEYEAEAQAEAEALGEPVRWERHVQAYVQGGELLVRLPGVRVLEQHPTDLDEEGVSVHRIYGHRPSGTVLVTSVDCYGEDCTCDPGTSSTILRWSPDTLATIDERPCGAGDDPDPYADERCQLGSGFVEDVDPWAL